jgi:UDP-N-acetylglucosamine--N-acetylmuramyl-(pentapeptide) pyrophosphoryl-undecaprenol N-acetylglucosamine transferase
VHLAASLGGHLELLLCLRDCFHGYRPVWVTAAGQGADGIRQVGDRVVDVPRLNRSRPLTAFRNVWRSLRIALRERPQVIVTSGAGSVVAFCVFGRLLGARIVFLETMARVTSPSASGRVLSRIAKRVLVQWEEMEHVYRNAVVCRPFLWEAMNGARRGPGGGTVVAVGTHRHPFDRLLRMVDRAVIAGILPRPVLAQSGHSTYRPAAFGTRDWVGPDELDERVKRAQYVVCHAGAGIISAALSVGHRPLVLPRWGALNEHVDDHQQQIVRKLASLGLVVPLDDEITEAHLAAANAGVPSTVEIEKGAPVSEVLREELHKLAAPRAQPSPARAPA